MSGKADGETDLKRGCDTHVVCFGSKGGRWCRSWLVVPDVCAGRRGEGETDDSGDVSCGFGPGDEMTGSRSVPPRCWDHEK